MTDRYSVDALAPQYDEIAGICMMGKPVILTRDNQELVLMNPVEFRKMMQLVSRIQETNKEKEAAVKRTAELEKELTAAREDLAKNKEDLDRCRDELAESRKELEDARNKLQEASEQAQRTAEAQPLTNEAPLIAESQISVGSQTTEEAQIYEEAQTIEESQTLAKTLPETDMGVGPAFRTADSFDLTEEAGQDPDTWQVSSDQDEEAGPDYDLTEDDLPVESIPDREESAGQTAIPYAGPASDDHMAHFLKAVAGSIEKRSRMEMEPVPEGLAIEAEGLTKKYSGVLANSKISLHVPYGAIYALLGMTGSGRSTLVRNLLGLSFPNSGQITLCSATGKELNDIRELTGSILDAPVLYEHMSINQNMVFRAKLLRLKTPKPAIKEALKKFGLFDKKRKKVRTLSTGMKQKLALSLAILGNPELLVLDEPLKGLDAADIALFCNVMMDMNARGSTILITDSRTDGIAGIATHYGILQNGELTHEFSAKQILENPIDLDAEYLAGGEV